MQVSKLHQWHLRNADHVIDERTWVGLKTGKAFVSSLASSLEIVYTLEIGVIAHTGPKGTSWKRRCLARDQNEPLARLEGVCGLI